MPLFPSRLLDSRLFLRVLAFAIFALAWQTYALQRESLYVPTFGATMVAVGEQLVSPAFWQAFYRSNEALVFGFAAALIIGIPLGLLMGRMRQAEQIADPYITILLVAPLAGLIPLLIMATGIGLITRIIIVWIFAIVMVVVNCRAGVRGVDPYLVDMVRLFGANELTIWRRVILPSAMPATLTGARIALGRAITGMVVVELLAVSAGLGGLLLRYSAYLDGPKMYATIFLIIIEALLLLAAVDWMQRWLTPWTSITNLRA